MANPPTASVTPARTPTLVPDSDTPFMHGRTLDLDDNLSEIQNEPIYGALVRASLAVTVTAAGAQNDVVRLTFGLGGGVPVAGMGSFVVSAVVPATPTTISVAAAIRDAINNSPALNEVVVATSAVAVVTVSALHPGLIGNAIRLLVTEVGTATTDIDGVATALANGTGNIAYPLENFVVQVGKTTVAMMAGRPIKLEQNMRSVLATCGRLVV